MLLVFLFNVIGYYGLYWLTRAQLRQDLQVQFDTGNYGEHETVTLKIPLALPYQLESSADFERVNGEFNYKGDYYKLVKQKLQHDTLYVVCYRDHQEKRLDSVVTDFIKVSNDLPATSKTLKLLNAFVKDFVPQPVADLQFTHYSDLPGKISSPGTFGTLDGIHTRNVQPPEFLLS